LLSARWWSGACGTERQRGHHATATAEPAFTAPRRRRKEDLLVFIAAARLRRKIPFNQLFFRLQRDLRAFFGSYASAEEKARELMFAAGDSDELEVATAQLDFGFLDPREGHFTVHRSLLGELPVILRVYVECAPALRFERYLGIFASLLIRLQAEPLEIATQVGPDRLARPPHLLIVLSGSGVLGPA